MTTSTATRQDVPPPHRPGFSGTNRSPKSRSTKAVPSPGAVCSNIKEPGSSLRDGMPQRGPGNSTSIVPTHRSQSDYDRLNLPILLRGLDTAAASVRQGLTPTKVGDGVTRVRPDDVQAGATANTTVASAAGRRGRRGHARQWRWRSQTEVEVGKEAHRVPVASAGAAVLEVGRLAWISVMLAKRRQAGLRDVPNAERQAAGHCAGAARASRDDRCRRTLGGCHFTAPRPRWAVQGSGLRPPRQVTRWLSTQDAASRSS